MKSMIDEVKGSLSNDGIIEKIEKISRKLGFYWGGVGDSFFLKLPDGKTCLRVYGEWGSGGVVADFDVEKGILLKIENEKYEKIGAILKIPPKYMPSRMEVISFVRKKIVIVNWRWIGDPVVEWNKEKQLWIINSIDSSWQVEVTGKKNYLKIIKLTRLT